MPVLDRKIDGERTVGATRDDDRYLALEIDKLFEDAARSAHPPPGLVWHGLGSDRDLPLAVIAHARALQHGAAMKRAKRPAERGRVGYLAILGRRDTHTAQKILFL